MTNDAIHLDPTAFPMIRVPAIGVYVHCLPVTKVQFEHFLCDANDGHFDARWYEQVLELNPRVTARRVWSGNYWNALLSGILPAEAERFAAWNGPGYRLLRVAEWRAFYRAMSDLRHPSLWQAGLLAPLGDRQRQLIAQLEAAVEEACARCGERCGMVERTLLRYGVVEWVAAGGRGARLWGGLGEPHPTFCGNLFDPAEDEPLDPLDGERQRLASCGFRLAFDPAQARPAT